MYSRYLLSEEFRDGFIMILVSKFILLPTYAPKLLSVFNPFIISLNLIITL
nr:MAG TPA: hypothetical protein [Caudoviricetes sp.]